MGKVLDETGLSELLTKLKTYIDTHGGGGGASSFSALDDVDLDNLTDGQIPKYNSTTQKWENADESGGVSNFVALDDVSITTPSDGDVIVYDSTNQVYKNSGRLSELETVIGTVNSAFNSLFGE